MQWLDNTTQTRRLSSSSIFLCPFFLLCHIPSLSFCQCVSSSSSCVPVPLYEIHRSRSLAGVSLGSAVWLMGMTPLPSPSWFSSGKWVQMQPSTLAFCRVVLRYLHINPSFGGHPLHWTRRIWPLCNISYMNTTYSSCILICIIHPIVTTTTSSHADIDAKHLFSVAMPRRN